MVTLTSNGFQTSYDLDGMFHDDAIWLAEEADGSVRRFRKIVEKFQLADRYVGEFWEIISQKRFERDKATRREKKAREEVERKFVEKYHKRGKEMNVPYSQEDGKEFWQGYKEGYNQGLKDMLVDTYYLDKDFELKLKQ